MTQLTPVFKLTLLASLGLHLVAIIQSGYLSTGHHQQTVDTRLNITLSQAAEPGSQATPTPEKTTKEKADERHKQPVAANPVTSTERKRPEVPREKPVRPYKEVLPQQAEQQRQKVGDIRSGITTEESYQSRLLRHLEQYKHYPFIARRRQLEGQVSVRVTIAANGQLQDIECLNGSSLFCEAALNAARKAQPFPPPPASMPDRTFDYAMEYKLR